MKFTAAVAAAAFALVPGTYGWAQAGNGVWIANNSWYTIRGVRVHEACTRMNTEDILRDHGCAYWIDGAGTIFSGWCKVDGTTINCLR